jgi:hypothetical protein
MEVMNLDLDLPVTAEQWDILAHTATAMGPLHGFGVAGEDPPVIEVVASVERAPEGWAEWLSVRYAYGEPEKRAARLCFNGGQPYAALDSWAVPESAETPPERAEALRLSFDRWVRDRWTELLRLAGVPSGESLSGP